MSEKILVPVLGESISEATVSKWLKNEGDNVEADEPIVELETDKVNLEVPSPISGVLAKINSKDGSTVEVGALLGSVSTNGNVSKKTETPKLDFHQASHSKYPSIVIHHAVKKNPARYVSFIYFYLPPKNVTQVGKRIYIYILIA